MPHAVGRAIAVVGVGAVLPDAPDAATFWANVKAGRASISEVPPDRWDPDLYYDPDPSAPDKTYSKIGGWVREYPWSPLEWRLPIPPKVAQAMDVTQRWAISACREALLDYGHPQRPLDHDRTAVVLGNAMAGEQHYLTSLRAYFPEYARELEAAPTFAGLPPEVRDGILAELLQNVRRRFPVITEDTMPGELGNIIAGRVANLFDFHGPNFVTDAACASALAAIDAAVEGLEHGDYDAVLTGGIDANMGVPSFIKFCKIGALSASGTRPYRDGADGFVMGEGAAVFLLKRLADAERAGDRVYAVIRGLGGSSDGKGKGITAPNPIGQEFAVSRAWRNAGIVPDAATYVEGHGTSTKVGDVVEVESLAKVFSSLGLRPGTIPLGSVKSNIGHLKSSAGAAGMLKAVMSLHDKVLAPSIGDTGPNPGIDFDRTPFYIADELREWKVEPGTVRTAGVSAFGFGGTNFHVVLEEYLPGRLDTDDRRTTFAVGSPTGGPRPTTIEPAAPLRGALVIGGDDDARILALLRQIHDEAVSGRAPAPAPPEDRALRAPMRLAIDYADAADLAQKSAKAIHAVEAGDDRMWKALRNQGVFRGSGTSGLVAFLYTGQGSQYVNMLAELREQVPVVAERFREADRVMAPVLGRPLTDYVFVDPQDAGAVAAAQASLMETEVTQPAVLTVDAALTDMLAAYGIRPDMVMGHSLGEYGALVAAGALPFPDALEAVAGRGREMANVEVEDRGLMAAVFAPLEEVERAVAEARDYVVVANLNSNHQAVIGGSTPGVEAVSRALSAAGHQVVRLPVSHAFHTEIVAPAAEPLQRLLERLRLESPAIPLVANLDGRFYPMGPNVTGRMIEILGRQIASPVQFVEGLRTLYEAGCRVFVEVGPKRALHGFVEDVLGGKPDVVSLFTNHPKQGDLVSFNHALCGLYAAGLGGGTRPVPGTVGEPAPEPPPPPDPTPPAPTGARSAMPDGDLYTRLGHVFADALAKGYELLGAAGSSAAPRLAAEGIGPALDTEPVVVTGAGLGLPGRDRVFADDNVAAILHGDQLIDTIPTRFRRLMTEKHITRLVKTKEGGGRFEDITSQADVIKLAGRAGALDLVEEFGFPEERVDALERSSALAIGAGLEALRDAGIPLVMRYKETTTGGSLPERWMLPAAYRDTTGVIFASAFPGADGLVAEVERFNEYDALHRRLEDLESLRRRMGELGGSPLLAEELDRRIHELESQIAAHEYQFDRKFLFHVVAFGHAQFAEYIGARGPNTQVNAACASTTQAVAIAEDWIRAGRCDRVVVISGDDVTSDHLLEWVGSGFLAVGAAATDDVVEEAATPFDRRRHGMILGMGAAALVVERATSARERGIRPIGEVLSTITANSAFHGSRLDTDHIRFVMQDLIETAERRWGIDRQAIAPKTVFISHETYTPARGGSAQAEIDALRHVFGASADRIVISNTKGFTGHAMGVGVEDVVALKALETGIAPPVPNFREPDPELGDLNLSKGGAYPIEYALRLGAGFGSQISLTLYRAVPNPSGGHRPPDALGFEYRIADRAVWRRWLEDVTGIDQPTTEIVKRTLRVRDDGRPERAQAPASAARGPQPVAPTPAAPPPLPPAAAAPLPPPPAAAQGPSPTPWGTNQEPEPATGDGAPVTVADEVAETVLGIVAAQTGYPPEMLDLDLDLEADLGIDTVKQAETFAAIREAYGIERDDTLALRDYPTLASVIGFVRDRRPDLAAPLPAAAPAAEPVTVADEVAETVLGIVAAQTGYPPEMLDLDLDLEADLGIDTVKQAETFAAIREAYGIERDDTLALRDYPTLASVIGFVRDRRPDLAAPLPAAAPAAEPVTVADEVAETVLGIVAAQTGYPPEMLDLDLDLEADLGIDTVKQAETFAAIREAYGIERDDTLALRDYPTLASVIGFVRDRRPDLAAPLPAAAPAAEPVTGDGAPETDDGITGDDEASARLPRRIPVPVLRPALDLCAPTGVELGEGSRVVVMPDSGGVGAALVKRLEKRGVEVLLVDGHPTAGELEQMLDSWAGDGPVTGVYWLPALDHEPEIDRLDLAGWREGLRVRVKLLYATMRHLYDRVGGPGTFLVAATRMGGCHGYDLEGALAPMGGAVTGFGKAFKRERPDALVKVVDVEPSRQRAVLADRLIDETLADPGAVEIGYQDGLRWTVGLRETALPAEPGGLVLDGGSVVVVTGAAGSIVSAITADLAAASGGTFHLLDLVPEPDRDDPDVAAFATDRDDLKTVLYERLKASGERATPAMVERELARIERAAAALSAIGAIEAAGGAARYHPVNLLDGDAVGAVMTSIVETHGKVDLLLHAGGLEISRLLPDKEPGEYDLVFDVKADGWFNLLTGLGHAPLGAAVVFSSVAGRFGNAGQADYSAANDLLCKSISHLRRSRPGTQGLAIDWTAWGDIGMATRGSIPTMMKAAGIDMLPAAAGIPVVRREVVFDPSTRELVVGLGLGVLLDEWSETGGLDLSHESPVARLSAAGPMVGRVTGMGIHEGLTVVTALDPAGQPFLDHHRIDGTPVLPGVMGVEAFAAAAALLHPDRFVSAIEDVEFLAPFKFYRDEPREVTVHARFRAEGDDLVADCVLTGERALAGQAEPQVTTHFTGRVRLSPSPPEPATRDLPDDGSVGVAAPDIYRIYFHGPAYQVLANASLAGAEVIGRMAENLPPDHLPEDLPPATEPRLLELCFQTAGVWEIGTSGGMALPSRIGAVRRVPVSGGPRPVRAVVRPSGDGSFDAEVVDDAGRVVLTLSGYRTSSMPGTLAGNLVGPIRAAMSE
jgi:acyl transferase domain-containing protein/acyl carrier protein